MIKKISLLLLFSLTLWGCSNQSRPESDPSQKTRLVVYSPHGPEVLGDYEKRFEAAFPEVDVQWLDLGSQEVYNRVKSEQRRPYADVWWGGPSSIFAQAAEEGLLEAYRPSWAEEVDHAHHDNENRWYGTYRTPLSIVFNSRQYSRDDVPQTWDDLLGEKWRGKLVFRKPHASGTMRTFIAAMIWRAPDVEEGLTWLKQLHDGTTAYLENPQMLFDHLKRRPEHITVWLQADVILQRERNGYPLDCVVPPETVVLTEGIALLKNAPHRTWAERFYEFVTSSDSLIHQAHAYAKMPARRDIDPSKLPEWMQHVRIEEMPIDWGVFAQNEMLWCARWEKEIYQQR